MDYRLSEQLVLTKLQSSLVNAMRSAEMMKKSISSISGSIVTAQLDAIVLKQLPHLSFVLLMADGPLSLDMNLVGEITPPNFSLPQNFYKKTRSSDIYMLASSALHGSPITSFNLITGRYPPT